MTSAFSNPNLIIGAANVVVRPVAAFKPSPWTDRFLGYTLEAEANKSLQELAKELKEELDIEMRSIIDKPLKEQLCLIDSVERLGVAYHFEKEIDDALQRIHEMTDSPCDDLFLTSLRFRLLRQHGFNASSDVVKGFINSDGGSLKEEVANDVEGILSLYEACHVRGHEDAILDEALALSMSKLKPIQDQLSHPFKEQVCRALHKPLHKRATRLESVHHINVYKQDPSHHKTLLRFAKVDFNLLQSSHRKEISDLCRWWKDIGVISKLPLRDRIVECYLWASMVFYEPQFSLGRKLFTKGIQIVTTVDDLYDAYGMPEELEIFTEAIRRWDRSCLDQLPGKLGMLYELVLDVVDEMEKDAAVKGRSQYIKYVKEEMILQCEAYHTEAIWRHRDYVPTLDEYMGVVHRNIGYVVSSLFAFLDVDTASHAEFEWVCSLSKPIKALSFIMRILDDIGSGEVDKKRDHSPLVIECHMKHYGVSYEQACKELYEKAGELWKDINEAMIPPREVPFPVIKRIHHMVHPLEFFYDGGIDGFTSISPNIEEGIQSLFVDPMPINED